MCNSYKITICAWRGTFTVKLKILLVLNALKIQTHYKVIAHIVANTLQYVFQSTEHKAICMYNSILLMQVSLNANS